jgi:inosose dehydratase
MSNETRLACAPISWGVIEIPDWGYQMDPDAVLREAAELGVKATEAGPDGFLPDDAAEVSEKLEAHGLDLIGGFVPVVLHDKDLRDEQLAIVERRARFFADAGGTTVVLAAATGSESYEQVVEMDEGEWSELFDNLKRAEEISARHGLTVTMHSHYGTVIETDEQLWRFLEGCDTGLCLDTGHLIIGGSDPVEVARQAGERVNHVHLKDVDLELARRMANRELSFKEACMKEAFRPLGEGEAGVGSVIEHLENSGYGGWYVLEQDCLVPEKPKPGEGPIQDVRKSLGFLRTQLQ